MLLPPTTTSLSATVGPPHGLSCTAVRQRVSPVLASRQNSARSPIFSSSRKAEATSTLSPTTATGASTCHFSCPFCQTLAGAGLGSWSSLGGTAKSGSFFLSASYLASSSAHL